MRPLPPRSRPFEWIIWICAILLTLLCETSVCAGFLHLEFRNETILVEDKASDKVLKLEVPESPNENHRAEILLSALDTYVSRTDNVEDQKETLPIVRTCYSELKAQVRENDSLLSLLRLAGYESSDLVQNGGWNPDHDWLGVSLNQKPYCSWRGIHCETPPEAENYPIARLPVITRIVLSREGMTGAMPTLKKLRYLKLLDLSHNRLTGTLPTELFTLPSLEHLVLSHNLLTGALPVLDQPSSLPLVSLNLLHNHISGPLPTLDVWKEGVLKNLRQLDMSRNQLSGGVPLHDLSRAMPNLHYLWLGCNLLEGELSNRHEGWKDWGEQLELLDVGSNVLSGHIPTALSSLSHLETLILADNDFTGTIPDDIFRLSKLKVLQLQDNALSGIIPSGENGLGWSNLSDLGALFLRYNRLNGTIPSSFCHGQKASMRHVDLSYNRLTGTIPTDIGVMEKLHTIGAAGNLLRGSLPTEMSELNPSLRLNFSDNMLTGTIPAVFCGLGSGNILYRKFGCDAVLCRPGTFSPFGHATLHTGCVPCPSNETEQSPVSSVLGRVSCPGIQAVHGDLNGDGILSTREILHMVYIDTLGRFWGLSYQNWVDLEVNECDLAGIDCNNRGAVVEIDLSGANICSDGQRHPGPIQFCSGLPTELGLISSLQVIDLENQRFLRGTIPTELGQLSDLRTLRFSGCSSLSGKVPSELEKLSRLSILHLTHSRVSGTFPVELTKLSKLRSLRLTNNRLSGTIPAAVGEMRELVELLLSRNELFGTIPTELGSLRLLENLEAYHNQLSGSIPWELSNCPKIKRIDVFNNALTGTIPEEFSRMKLLQILHLKGNELTGTIPPGFGNIPALAWFDVSQNKLHGTVPDSFGTSANIKDLRLGDNMLHDPLPPVLCRKAEVNNGATERHGCNGILCELGTFSETGYAVGDVGCRPCPTGQSTLYRGSTFCTSFGESDYLSMLLDLSGGTENVDGKDLCDWDGVTCDTNGEIISLSFPPRLFQ